jgi:hypothetical protein
LVEAAFSRFIWSLAVPLCGVVMLTLSAQAASGLLENSPFLPPGAVAGVALQAAPLELRSIVKSDGQFEFSLYDSARKQSTWVRLKEPGHDFLVKAYDAANGLVTVEQRSRTYTLALKEARIVPLAMIPGSPSSSAGVLSSTTGAPQPEAVVPNTWPDSVPMSPEQLLRRETLTKRLQEAARRRAAASPGSNPPVQSSLQGQTR